jgi:puromycin-sensitive aminopeptidase
VVRTLQTILILLRAYHSAFPCWDEPAVKATFGVTLIIPSHLTALSNMPETSSTHVAGSSGTMLKKVVFDTSPKMSTYLLAWAVGEFDFVQGVTKGGVMLRVFSPPGRGTQGQFALDVGIRALDFFDHFFNVCDDFPLRQHVTSGMFFVFDVVMRADVLL